MHVRKLFHNRLWTIRTKSFTSAYFNEKDDLHFKKIKDWWNPEGSMFTLHYFNDLRIKYMTESLKKELGKDIVKTHLPFDQFSFIDVGSGGGLLCESIARLGGNVIGIDTNSNSNDISTRHLDMYEGEEKKILKDRVSYFLGSVDDFKKENSAKSVDVLTAMEVIEHVNSPDMFLKDLSTLIKPGGFLFLSTINKTQWSYITTILLAEKLLGIIPNETHDWNKYITPTDLSKMLRDNGFAIRDISGVTYNPLTSNMSLTKSLEVNYIVMARKLDE